MALSKLAQQFAAEIRQQEWSDAPYRIDRAGHRREHDSHRGETLTNDQTRFVRTNVMWVTAQVLGYNDPNFDVYEFAEACGVDTRTRSGRPRDGSIQAGVREKDGQYAIPGTLWEFDQK